MQSAQDNNKVPGKTLNRDSAVQANGQNQAQTKPVAGCENQGNASNDQPGNHSTVFPACSPSSSAKFVKDLNQYITCNLCKGYLVDATTIIECLHSYCRACIVMYMDQDNAQSRICPKCNGQIHKTKPKQNIRSDPTLQDIVYKLVPKLYKNEMSRRKTFYSKHPDKAIGLSNEEKGEIHAERMILSPDDNIQLTIEYFPEVSSPFKLLPFKNDENQILPGNMNQRRYLLCKAGMRVLHLIKFIRYKYDLDVKIQVDFFYKQELLREDLTIMDLAYIYTWGRNMPIPLYYLIIEPDKDKSDYLCLFSQSKIGLPRPPRQPKRRRVLKNVLEPSNCNAQVSNRPASNTHNLVSSNQRLFGSPTKSPGMLVNASRPMLNTTSPSSMSHKATPPPTTNKGKLNDILKRKINESSNNMTSGLSDAKKTKVASKENLKNDSMSSVANSQPNNEITFTEDDSSTDISETSYQIDIICKSYSNASCSDAANFAGDASTSALKPLTTMTAITNTTTTTATTTDKSSKPKQANTGDKQLNVLPKVTENKSQSDEDVEKGKSKLDAGSATGAANRGSKSNDNTSCSNGVTREAEEEKLAAEPSVKELPNAMTAASHQSAPTQVQNGSPPETSNQKVTKKDSEFKSVDSSATGNLNLPKPDVIPLLASNCSLGDPKSDIILERSSVNSTTESTQVKPTANGHSKANGGDTAGSGDGTTNGNTPVEVTVTSSNGTTFPGSFLLTQLKQPNKFFPFSIFSPTISNGSQPSSLNLDVQLSSSVKKPVNLK